MRIISADDHPLMLDGLSSLLTSSGHTIVAKCHSGRELLAAVKADVPDAVTLDVGMPEMNGFAVARQLRSDFPAVKVVFVTQQTDAAYIREAFDSGAWAFVPKQSAGSELLVALQAVQRGRRFIARSLVEPYGGMQAALNSFEKKQGRNLTERQREVLQLVSEGKTAKEVAACLSISVKTVEFHKQSIMDALNLRTTAELTRFAIAHGLTAL